MDEYSALDQYRFDPEWQAKLQSQYMTPMSPEQQALMLAEMEKNESMRVGPKKKIMPTPEGNLVEKQVPVGRPIVQTTAQYNPEAEEMAIRQKREAALADVMNQQKSGVSGLEETLRQIKGTPRQIDFSALASYFDSVVPGSKLAQGYKAPETEPERQTRIAQLEGAIQRERGNLSQNEAAALKAQLDDLASRRDKPVLNELRRAQINALNAQAGVKSEKSNENDIQEFSKRVGDAPASIQYRLGELKTLIPSDAKEVPGAGVGASLVPDFLLSEKGQAVQQHARGLVGDLIKLQSGTAASEGEVARKMKELGMGPGSSTESFIRGLKNVEEKAAAELKAKEAGFRPEVIDRYKSRGGVSSEGFAKPQSLIKEWQGKKYKLQGNEWIEVP